MSEWIPSEKGLRFMSRKRIVRLAEMTEHLGCSDRTTHRRFKKWGVIKRALQVFAYMRFCILRNRYSSSLSPQVFFKSLLIFPLNASSFPEEIL